MIVPGLASVTFRHLSSEEVVDLAAQARLGMLEWGADVHVRPGEYARAERVRGLCADAGLDIGTYGSYYKAGHGDPDDLAPVLGTAAALGARRVRVWAGVLGSAQAAPADRERVAADLRRCAARAAEHGLAVTVEYHVDSLTDTLDSATRLLAQAGTGHRLVPHWQPREEPDTAECLAQVGALLPDLAHVHVFSWGADGFTERLPLAERADLWRPLLGLLARDGDRRDAVLEFVPDDSPEAFLRDAASLRSWIAETA
ncbi:xylose isomerase [Nocardiopsis sp. TSRI0078]|uniref:sugar phosphate isomerase/epimerase family protein n=1 Tax=unclassified Nocardiopsis TaxID=2649073 RepID=UPI00093B86F8|nr:TIM barrel protein [Nocardiopsis sp. TSRI0078]OKI12396.1 xylose isomerase [Nocardiopsis sp. TSRI0078]